MADPRVLAQPPANGAAPARPDPLVWLRRAAIAVVLAWGVVPIALLIVHLIRHGGVLTGSEGPAGGADQLFYMDAIRQSGEHGLIADNFDLALGGRVFVHPLYLLAGAIWRLGVPLQAAFWSLKLLAASAFAIGVLALLTRVLQTNRQRVAALAVAFFYMSPIVPLLIWTGTVSGFRQFELELPASASMPGWLMWGGEHAVVAVGLLALALVGAASVTSGEASKGRLAWIAVAAALASWLHPWQGATFILVAVALMLSARSWHPARALTVPVAAAALPLLYEWILVRADAAWKINSDQTSAGGVPFWMLAVVLLPLIAVAILGLRVARPGPLRTVLVAWPLASLALYLFGPGFRYHALNGITVPLAALAVLGWARAPRRRSLPAIAAVAAVAALAFPAAAFELTSWRDSVRAHFTPYWFTDGEHAALAYLQRTPTPGGVLARYYMGMAVPAFTGRRTWVGSTFWTPSFPTRALAAQELLDGSLSPPAARALARATRARFVLKDCRASGDLVRLLGPMVASTRRFGCAAVYQLRG